ncbi:MAG: nuclear transport factor 2 family protein [Marinifilaceae bacterium]|jgi:hypothetical protein|nr:nuclear transport factor 2 family protein [Marinifilaceae bacterium]
MSEKLVELNKQKSLDFLKALECKNLDAVVDLFDINGVQNNPYASGLFTSQVIGHTQIREYWSKPFSIFPKLEFIINNIRSVEDDFNILIECKGRIELPNHQGWYENDYYLMFKFNNQSKIVQYDEIFNPIVAARAFGLVDKIS